MYYPRALLTLSHGSIKHYNYAVPYLFVPELGMNPSKV
jgi:hypothetical protein